MNNIKQRVEDISQKVVTDKISLPKSVKIELVSICNHNCKYCIVPKKKAEYDFMLVDDFRTCMQEMHKNKIKEVGLFHMGESTLHPFFKGLVRYCTETYPDIKYFLTTNGTMLDNMKYAVKCNINSIKISLNGYNKERHQVLTGVDDFDLIIKNIEDLVRYRNEISSHTEISASSIFCNDYEMEEFAKKIEKVVDCYYQTQIYNQAAQVEERLEIPELNGRVIPELCKKPCFGLYNLCHIKSNGTINLCRFGRNEEFDIGNIWEGFEKVWFGEKAQKIRELHMKDQIETCKKCIYGF